MRLFKRTLSADCETPVSIFSNLRDKDGQCFLFESAEGGEHWGRYSIIGFSPSETVTEQQQMLITEREDGRRLEQAGGNILEWIRSQAIESSPVENHDDLPFTGGAVGYFTYNIIHRFEPCLPIQQTDAPIAAFMLIDTFIVMDNLRGVIHICVVSHDEHRVTERLDAIESKLNNAKQHPEPMRLDLKVHDLAETDLTAHTSPEKFHAMVAKAKEYILAGDIFQVVLSQQFSTPLQCDPLLIYRAVRHINPSPYLFYMHIGDTILIGSSPEILVRKEKNRAIVRPIAGTRPRGKSLHEDLALEKELLADEKERAEHVMLVDLGRNDLGRVCNYGSVHLKESMTIERYSHVMHIVSQVEGQLRDDVDALDLLAATFPAGTVSGAPKVRAMQIIDELETDRPRGAYAGCIGYISFGGEFMDTAITIRTAIIRDNTIFAQAGAGIVADSIAENEQQECVNKASAIVRAVCLATTQQDRNR
ncbi:MAG: anthranilate synthase component I [Zetaproteobacteria bacterium]|nr:anthranilate synthase component I [Zetaproteobacteria bacterium]